MNLHEHREDFEELIAIVADYIGVPADAVRRDYYIVQLMQNLQNSEYAETCVFKGGTSLSKCYPGSIDRFSEDIDLTFIPVEDMNNKKYSRTLKRIEDAISKGFCLEKIEAERNDRNKSAYVWPENESRENCRVKLEIGSSVRPDPFSKRSMKTYIQEYLEETDSFYLQKRNVSEKYDPLEAYAFESWKQYFDDEIRGRYETLHEDLLYTSERQSFAKAEQAFEYISHVFASIDE